MKKKVLTVALVVALLAIMVSGTLAYFTANDEVTNTFTIGSVKIEIYENDTATETDVRELGTLVPVADEQDLQDDDSYIAKSVEVLNTGKNDAYIRTHIAVPTALVEYLHLDMNAAGWIEKTSSTATVNGVAYTVYTYDYDTAVTSGNFTGELLTGVYLGMDVDLEENADGHLVFVKRVNGAITDNSGFVAHTLNADGTYTSAKVNILVASQAIQAEGFTGAAEALDAGFGSANPWQ